MGAAVDVSVQVFMVLSKDKVLQRFVEQIIVDDKVLVKVQQLARAVSPGKLDITSSCCGVHTPSCLCDSLRKLPE